MPALARRTRLLCSAPGPVPVSPTSCPQCPPLALVGPPRVAWAAKGSASASAASGGRKPTQSVPQFLDWGGEICPVPGVPAGVGRWLIESPIFTFVCLPGNWRKQRAAPARQTKRGRRAVVSVVQRGEIVRCAAAADVPPWGVCVQLSYLGSVLLLTRCRWGGGWAGCLSSSSIALSAEHPGLRMLYCRVRRN